MGTSYLTYKWPLNLITEGQIHGFTLSITALKIIPNLVGWVRMS